MAPASFRHAVHLPELRLLLLERARDPLAERQHHGQGELAHSASAARARSSPARRAAGPAPAGGASTPAPIIWIEAQPLARRPRSRAAGGTPAAPRPRRSRRAARPRSPTRRSRGPGSAVRKEARDPLAERGLEAVVDVDPGDRLRSSGRHCASGTNSARAAWARSGSTRRSSACVESREAGVADGEEEHAEDTGLDRPRASRRGNRARCTARPRDRFPPAEAEAEPDRVRARRPGLGRAVRVAGDALHHERLPGEPHRGARVRLVGDRARSCPRCSRASTR